MTEEEYKQSRWSKLLIDLFGIVFFIAGAAVLEPHWAFYIPATFAVLNMAVFVNDLFSDRYK